jgi:hypothetical protein
MRPPGILVFPFLGAVLLALISPARAEGLSWVCGYCRISAGVGETYHFWARTGGIVAPVTFLWDDERYELGIFRFATRQELEYQKQEPDRKVANSYWGFSANRRFELFGPPSARVFIGIGASYKNETDELNSTRWNFAEQLGVRFSLPGHAGLELCLRHWSNAGIKLPNHGQDFFTLSYVF